VAPEWRGRGVATLLMTRVLDRAVACGDAVSVLFPAAVPPYRKLGYEVAGSVWKTTFPAAALRRLGTPDVAVRRPSVADVDEIVDLMARDGARRRASGPLELDADDVREMVSDADNMCYLASDGFLVYAWDGADLRVERLVAASPETTRALWALVGSGASAVRNVYTYQPLHDAVHWMLDTQALHEVGQERWMLRVVDVRAAVEGRGFPAGVTADVPLRLDDSWLEGGAGSFRLRVEAGTGELVPDPDVGPDAVRLGPAGLAALYAGTPTSTLQSARLVGSGSPRQLALLDAAFASHPYLIDTF
jgi:predicted acetyltransferase